MVQSDQEGQRRTLGATGALRDVNVCMGREGGSSLINRLRQSLPV
jgi:hypothetical protein